MLDLLISTVGQGLQWSVLALGVFLTFRILDIADLSVEGSFPLGAAAAATAITSGLGLPAAFVLALIAGALAGAVTGILTTKLRIPALLAGILTMIGALFGQSPCHGQVQHWSFAGRNGFHDS